MIRLPAVLRRLGREGAVLNARIELADAELRVAAVDAVARRLQTVDAARAAASLFAPAA